DTPEGAIGEINAQYIHGKVVLTYCDEKRGVIVRLADRPDALWTKSREIVTRLQEPSLYAPSIHPWSPSLEDAYLHLSSWRQWDGRTIDYCARGYRVNLTGNTPGAEGAA
ncbi:DUF4185 domain-containing protein, partial [Streptococcus pyogenes]